AQHARPLARGRADAAGELGEVVGLVQPLQRLAPQPAVDEVVPLRDEVVDRAAGSHALEEGAGVAEGDAAVHAAGALLAQQAFVGVLVDLVPVGDAPLRRARQRQLPRVLQKTGRLAHVSTFARWRSANRAAPPIPRWPPQSRGVTDRKSRANRAT